MNSYRLKLQTDKSVKILETTNKPTGIVLHPVLSSNLLMKYPRLSTGKIIRVSASELLLQLDKWSES
jgi:hypothetical protein